MGYLIRASQWVCLFFSSTFFTGFIPSGLRKITGIKMPGGGGLMGSLVALGLSIWLYVSIGDINGSTVYCGVVGVTFYVLGLFVIRPAEELMYSKWGYRERHTGEKTKTDYNETNIDEFAPQMILSAFVLFLLTVFHNYTNTKDNGWITIPLLVAFFIVFRVLDTNKPWKRDSTIHGWEVMRDDSIAVGYIMFVVMVFFLALLFVASLFHVTYELKQEHENVVNPTLQNEIVSILWFDCSFKPEYIFTDALKRASISSRLSPHILLCRC